jgi:hypothetical protein
MGVKRGLSHYGKKYSALENNKTRKIDWSKREEIK